MYNERLAKIRRKLKHMIETVNVYAEDSSDFSRFDLIGDKLEEVKDSLDRAICHICEITYGEPECKDCFIYLESKEAKE